jgi:molybdate transport system ATP-binding protein
MLDVRLNKMLGPMELDVAFTHDEGVLILFGRSGAGKTSILRMIAGFDRPERGAVRFADQTWSDTRARVNRSVQSRGVGFMFQTHNLFPHMTARQNVAYAARDQTEIDGWLERFGVGHLGDRYPARLSGGEQQRVAIIRALVARPRLLLMDEPLSSVDMATRTVLLSELRDMQRASGVPMIYVTHSVSEAYGLGDRVLVLDQGKVVQDGLPIDVFHFPTTLPVANLVGNENMLSGVIAKHHPADGTTELRVGGIVFHVPLCPEAVGASSVIAIRPEDILLASHNIPDTSARNQFVGRADRVEQDTTPSVLVKLRDGPTIRARVTRRSIETLRLTEGATVYVLIKAWACHRIDANESE